MKKKRKSWRSRSRLQRKWRSVTQLTDPQVNKQSETQKSWQERDRKLSILNQVERHSELFSGDFPYAQWQNRGCSPTQDCGLCCGDEARSC